MKNVAEVRRGEQSEKKRKTSKARRAEHKRKTAEHMHEQPCKRVTENMSEIIINKAPAAIINPFRKGCDLICFFDHLM